MRFHHFLAFSFICVVNSTIPETALVAAMAHDHASAQNSEAKLDTHKIEVNDNKNPVTNAIIDLGIPLRIGLNNPAPGLKMELYTKIDGHITVETEITLEEGQLPHPLVAKLLAIIGYQPRDCGYFWCTEPKISQTDAHTKAVSIKNSPSCCEKHYQNVHVNLRTLLDDQQICKYIATLQARKDAKKIAISERNLANFEGSR